MARFTERRLRPRERRVETNDMVVIPYSWCDSFHVEGFIGSTTVRTDRPGDLFPILSVVVHRPRQPSDAECNHLTRRAAH